ncbi:MAG: lipopolysaccharide biosynthesis protein [Pseudomonadota bacterium]
MRSIEKRSVRWHRLGAEGFWIALGQAAVVAGSLVLVRTLTTAMAPADYGRLALGLTIAGLANQMITGSISNALSRFWSIADERNDRDSYIIAAKRMIGIACLVVIALGCGFLLFLHFAGLAEWTAIAVAALALALSSGLNAALNGIQTAARQRKVVALHSAADAWLKIGLSLLFLHMFGIGGASAIWGYAISATLVSLSQIVFLRRLLLLRAAQPATAQSLRQIPIQWMKDFWGYAWPFMGWGLFTWLQTSSDRWALQAFAGPTEVGRYAALYQLGFAPLTTASGLLVTLLTPILFQKAGDASDAGRIAQVYDATARIARAMLGLTVAATIAFLLLHDWIFTMFTSGAFRTSSHLMPLMAAAAGLQACHHVLGVRISSLLKTRSLLVPQILSAISFAVLNMAGAYIAGLAGLMVALCLASAFYAGWMWALSQALKPEELKKAHSLTRSSECAS